MSDATQITAHGYRRDTKRVRRHASTLGRLLRAWRALADQLSMSSTRRRATTRQGLDESIPIEVVGEPQFTANLLSKVSYALSARVKRDVLNLQSDPQRRMAGIIALQSMPTRSISPLLHRLLTDPVDDIRLLAYGMLETIEKTLTQRITAEQSKLLSPISEEERYRSDKALAQAYKELVYSRIVQGDVRRNAAEQADTFARSALGFNPLDAGLWQLRGLLALEARRADDAEAMFRRAVECGFPRQRLLPYLAEIAYLRGDYVEIRSLFSESKGIAPPLLASVVAYWNS